MATSRDIELVDLFPTASVITTTPGSESIDIPLADLVTDGGLDLTELQSGDARKIFFAIIRTGAKAMEDITNNYNTRVRNLKTWATGTSFAVNDEVEQSGKIYKATVAHTAGNTFSGDAANWNEETVQAPPLNFTSRIAAANYGSGDFGSATITQTMSFTATYSGTTDIKPE